MIKREFLNLSIHDVINTYPFMEDYFKDNENIITDYDKTFEENLNHMREDELEDLAVDKESFLDSYYEYFNSIMEFLGVEDNSIDSLTILRGFDKSGKEEEFDIEIKKGEILSIVGPTGSGKSRLLGDIEWIANRDTPTKRKILINGKEPDKNSMFSTGNKLVAQLSQNMNFVMDLKVSEFITLHAESRMVPDIPDITKKIIEKANYLAGESFDLNTPITSLSGGQSRALMIADTAILSKSPIVLIDEIENAGIDRKKAINLLVEEEKIVLIATHDPILSLMADKRIVIKNGGIAKLIETSKDEKEMLLKLEKIDKYLLDRRQDIRYGRRIELEDIDIF